MTPHLHDDNRTAIFCGIVIIVMLLLGLWTNAYAIPHIMVSDSGDDNNDGSVNAPVQTEAGITRLCSVNGAIPDDCDTGLKWSNGDTPTMVSFNFLMQFSKKKHDRVSDSGTTEVIPGHGNLPDTETVGSNDNGWRAKQKYIWEVFIAPNGKEAERMIRLENTIEVY